VNAMRDHINRWSEGEGGGGLIHSRAALWEIPRKGTSENTRGVLQHCFFVVQSYGQEK
jgi:hypothetical protein